MENTLPHDLEAEAAVLGSCLLDNGAIPYVCSKLQPDSFYMRSHAAVFEAIQNAHEKNETVDEITLRDKLGGRHKELIYNLITRVPSSSLLDKWVGVVRKHALARRAILACHNGLRDLEDAGLPDDVVAKIIEDLEGARSGAVDHDPVSIATILMRPGALDDKKVAFDIPILQQATQGVAPGGFVLIAGKEGAGKTTLCMQLMADIAKKGNRVHIWSKDQVPEDLSKILWAGLENKTIEDVIADAANNFERVGSLPIYFDECEFTVENVLNSMRIQAAQGVAWFLLDYLGLVETPGKHFNADWMRSVYVAKRIKNLVLDLEVYAFIIQEVTKGERGHPRIEDIAGGRSLLHAAHQVWYLEAPELKKGEEEGVAKPTDFYIFKNRHGRRKRIQLDYLGARHRFESWRG